MLISDFAAVVLSSVYIGCYEIDQEVLMNDSTG